MGEDGVVPYSSEVIHLISFDLPSENIRSLSEKERAFLSNMRSKIWYHLRYNYGCRQLQKSLWLVPEDSLKRVTKAVERWEDEYKKAGYLAKLWVFPVRTSEQGLEAFEVMEVNFLILWLEKDMKHLEKASIDKPSYDRIMKKVELIERIVDEDFSGVVKSVIRERLRQLQELVSAFKKWSFEVTVHKKRK